MVMPGDNVTIDVELIHPIAVEQGTTFSIREGGRTVGSGYGYRNRSLIRFRSQITIIVRH